MAIMKHMPRHIKGVFSIWFLTFLFTLGECLFVVIAYLLVPSMSSEVSAITPEQARQLFLITILIVGGIVVLQAYALYALFKRQNKARILLSILSVFSLLSIPIGTVLGIYTLYVIWGKEGNTYFIK